MSIFEAGMLICFGISWPFAIAKVIKVKSVKGVSLLFLSLVFIGYICGIMHKYFYNFDWVSLLYVYNGTLVLAQIILYFIYVDKKENDNCPHK
jgi:uncharacterized protein with PQ loop repeat